MVQSTPRLTEVDDPAKMAQRIKAKTKELEADLVGIPRSLGVSSCYLLKIIAAHSAGQINGGDRLAEVWAASSIDTNCPGFKTWKLSSNFSVRQRSSRGAFYFRNPKTRS